MKTHYRQPLSFVFEELEEGKNMVRSIINTLLDLDLVSASKDNDVEIKKVIDQTRQGFKEALDNDLNISEALAVFFSFLNFLNKNLSRLTRDQAEKAKKFIFELDQVLGFIEKFYNAYQEKLKELIGKSEVSQLLEARKFARQEKDYAKADKLRGDIANQGLLIEDRNGLSVIKLKSFL
jgi:cysteinyl-tRNA synthetase